MNKAAFVGIFKDNKVLMVRSLTSPRYSDHWSFPGGLVDEGEDYEQAAIREAQEEAGITCTIDRLVGEVENIEDGVDVRIFYGTYVSGDIQIQLHEVADARWFTVNEALKLPLAYDIERYLLETV